MMTPEEGLARIIEWDMSQRQYQSLRNELKSRNALCIPSYKKILDAKKSCIPRGLDIQHGKIEIGMQNVMDHQLDRLLMIDEYASNLRQYESEAEDVDVTFWAKDGMDSATAHSQYMTGDLLNHQSILTSYLTPVCLQVTWPDCDKKPENVFLNEMSNSPFGCCYLRMAFEKEDFGE